MLLMVVQPPFLRRIYRDQAGKKNRDISTAALLQELGQFEASRADASVSDGADEIGRDDTV